MLGRGCAEYPWSVATRELSGKSRSSCACARPRARGSGGGGSLPRGGFGVRGVAGGVCSRRRLGSALGEWASIERSGGILLAAGGFGHTAMTAHTLFCRQIGGTDWASGYARSPAHRASGRRSSAPEGRVEMALRRGRWRGACLWGSDGMGITSPRILSTPTTANRRRLVGWQRRASARRKLPSQPFRPSRCHTFAYPLCNVS